MSNSLLQNFNYGERRIEYRITFRCSEALGKVAIHVEPTGQVNVDAPLGTELSDIKKAIQKRARWVINHLDSIERARQHVLKRRYVSGESHFYIGRRYALKILETTAGEKVTLSRGQLNVCTNDTSTEHVKGLLKVWYRSSAHEVFRRRLEFLVINISWLDQVPKFKLLIMQKQWGSCSPNGVLYLNPNLVKAPRECIDYVLLHELCHLQEHNHSPQFYRLLAGAMHNWQDIKGKLDEMSELLLND